MNILINGDFLANNLTGIERCAFESCNNLDMLNKNYKLFILVPKNAKSIPNYKTINVIKINYTIKIRVFWSQVVFPIYALFHNMITFDFANSTPVINPGITVLHDIYCKTHSNDFNSITEKISGVYFRFLYRFISKHAIHIFTVSEFSKTEIIDTYKIPQNKITVMYNGWEYFSKIKPDYAIFDKYPELKNKSFFFCLGSLAKRKNITWISSYAEKHPESLFAISGKRLATLKFTEIEEINKLKNIFMLGYLSDNQVKALMEKSKAFILKLITFGTWLNPYLIHKTVGYIPQLIKL